VTPKFIKVDITNKRCRVWNDGRNIPCGLHAKEQIPIPELIFGNLLTSSNYNDAEERKTSGRNGLGIKCTNVFSKWFKLSVYNKDEGVMYEQEWSNNMKTKAEPVRKTSGFPKTVEEGKNGYTCVEWEPDFARFGSTEFSADMMNMMKKCVHDAAMTVGINKVNVLLNNQNVGIVKLTDYVNLYFNNPPTNIISIQTADSYVVVAPSVASSGLNKEWTPVSFVNGIFTKDGGIHVDKWAEALFRPVIEKLNSGSNKKLVDMRDIKKHFFMFVFADLDKPSFDSQSKHKLNGPAPTVEVKPNVLAKLLKWDFIQELEEQQKLKDMLTFAKESERKRGNSKVENLEDANWAGQKNKQCCLMVTEGLSAATYVVSGMKYGFSGYKGRDAIGVYPIRGKFVNVRNASAAVLSKNKELLGISRALGLVYGTDYTVDENFAKLRYKKLIIASDSDVDGFHICGLILNLFHTLYPSLLQRSGFLGFMRVPIIKIKLNAKQNLNFYFLEQAKEYMMQHKVTGSNVRYFKGLGTSNSTDIQQDFGKRLVNFVKDEKADQMMENIFGAEETDFRKQWMQKHQPRTEFPAVKDGEVENLKITDFLNLELINYSIDHCRRSIPSLIDGLKEATRKVLFAGFKKNLKFTGESMKVAQFASYVAEKTAYHHGENNLVETITKMAQRFVGSNQLPLFFNDGQFGSKSANGADAAAGRYIFTRLDSLTRLIFREEDEDYLTYLEEEGEQIEPETFIPIIPYVIVNGCLGSIGTGWSSSIPPHDLKLIIAWIKAWLNGESQSQPALNPSWRGFKGTVRVDGKKVYTTGILKEDKKRWIVTEIPLGKRMLSINKYREVLETLVDAGKIKSIDNQSTENQTQFSFLIAKEDFTPTVENMGLVDVNSKTNMVLFDSKGQLRKFASVEEILDEWCKVRFEFYNKRKAGMLAKLEKEAPVLYNKIRFIEMVVNEKIVLKGKDEEQLCAELKQHKFDGKDQQDGFEYLLSIQVKTMTSKKILELQKDYAALLAAHKQLKDTPVKVMWERELDELLTAYTKWNATNTI
jgi:DNA topoisomerase-2